MYTSELGNIGEAKVLYEFTKRQIPVFLPYGDGNRIDLIAIFNNKLNKIQIKTTEKLHDNSYMVWKVGRQEGRGGDRIPYSNIDVDFFCLYCLETDILCLVPFDDVDGKNCFTIRLDSFSGVKINTMHFVSDYNIDNIINAGIV